MRFCPNCDNILIPRNNGLYCRVCEKEFKFDPKVEDYTIIKIIKHNDREFAHIVYKNGLKIDKDRKTFEDFFHTS